MSEPDFILHGPRKELPKLTESLGEFFLRILSSKDPEHVALVAEVDGKEQTLTASNLLHFGKIVSLIYEEQGLKCGDTVMIAVGNTLDFAPVVYGACFSGIACSPVNPASETTDFRHLINVIKPQLVLCDEQSHRRVLEAVCQSAKLIPVISLAVLNRRLKMTASTEAFQLAKIADVASHVALVMNSSGTTGRPKGVEISQKTMLLMALGAAQNTPPMVGLSISGPYWASGCILQTILVISGSKLVLMQQFEEKAFLELIIKYKVNFTSIGPDQVTALAKWKDTEKYDLASLMLLFVSGARATQAMIDLAEKRLKKKITAAYGMTECFVGFEPPWTVTNKPGTVGKISPNASAKIVHPDSGKILGPMAEGELCFKTTGMLMGYRGNPEATKELFDEDGFLHSGDIAYYDEDGYFYIVDRIKELIKYKLNHVPACDIEEVILQHPGVKDVAVVGIPDVVDTEHATAFVIKAERSPITAQEITRLVEGKLAKLKWLHGGVVFVDSFPRTASGKVQKRVLRAAHLTNMATSVQE